MYLRAVSVASVQLSTYGSHFPCGWKNLLAGVEIGTYRATEQRRTRAQQPPPGLRSGTHNRPLNEAWPGSFSRPGGTFFCQILHAAFRVRFIACRRGCNQVDEVLYRHYDRKFEELVLALPPSKSRQAGTIFDESPEGKASDAWERYDVLVAQFEVSCQARMICISIHPQPVCSRVTYSSYGHRVRRGATSTRKCMLGSPAIMRQVWVLFTS